MGVLDESGDRRRGTGSFGDESGALLHSCVEVCIQMELSFGVVSGVGPGIHVLDGVHVPQGTGLFWGFLAFASPLV